MTMTRITYSLSYPSVEHPDYFLVGPPTLEAAEAPAGWSDLLTETVAWHLGEPAVRVGDFAAFVVRQTRFLAGVAYTDDERAIAWFAWRAARPELPWTPGEWIAAWDAWLAARP